MTRRARRSSCPRSHDTKDTPKGWRGGARATCADFMVAPPRSPWRPFRFTHFSPMGSSRPPGQAATMHPLHAVPRTRAGANPPGAKERGSGSTNEGNTMNPRPNLKGWLAPAIALLFLAGLIAPAVAGGPLPPTPTPPGTPAVAASNLLILNTDGSVAAWQSVGSNKTTVHVQGVQASASGFNLADPLGRLVGADQSSSAAGSVDFMGLTLLKGAYTLLGPSATSPAVVLARYDLAAFGVRSFPAGLPVTPSQVNQVAGDAAQACRVPVRGGELVVRAYSDGAGRSCVVQWRGAACLLDARTFCVWALSWAWAAKQCPASNTTKQCLEPRQTQAQDRPSPCIVFSPDPCQMILDAAASVLAQVDCYVANPLQCLQESKVCKDNFFDPNPCDPTTFVAEMTANILNIINGAGGGGGIPGVPNLCTPSAQELCPIAQQVVDDLDCVTGAATCAQCDGDLYITKDHIEGPNYQVTVLYKIDAPHYVRVAWVSQLPFSKEGVNVIVTDNYAGFQTVTEMASDAGASGACGVQMSDVGTDPFRVQVHFAGMTLQHTTSHSQVTSVSISAEIKEQFKVDLFGPGDSAEVSFGASATWTFENGDSMTYVGDEKNFDQTYSGDTAFQPSLCTGDCLSPTIPSA